MIQPYDGLHPVLGRDVYIHPRAVVTGDVRLGDRVSIWPGAVLRGDQGPIEVGEDANIQDNAVLHDTGGRSVTRIGPRVTVGHGAICHGCEVGPECIVGMGSILLDNCVIGPRTIVGAGALVPPGKRFPGGVLLLGSPARVARELTDEDLAWIEHSWKVYVETAARYRAGHG